MKTVERLIMYAVIELAGESLMRPRAIGPFSSPEEAYKWGELADLDSKWVVSELYIPGLD